MSGRIPCTEDNLKVGEWYVRHKVPQERRDDEGNIVAMGGTIYDPWLLAAEEEIVNDLLKFKQPVRLDDLDNVGQLTPLKVFKVLELLFRLNVKETGDVNDKRAEYFCSKYSNELTALPAKIWGQAQIIMQNGLVRG